MEAARPSEKSINFYFSTWQYRTEQYSSFVQPILCLGSREWNLRIRNFLINRKDISDNLLVELEV
jgi:hypothetical protein